MNIIRMLTCMTTDRYFMFAPFNSINTKYTDKEITFAYYKRLTKYSFPNNDFEESEKIYIDNISAILIQRWYLKIASSVPNGALYKSGVRKMQDEFGMFKNFDN